MPNGQFHYFSFSVNQSDEIGYESDIIIETEWIGLMAHGINPFKSIRMVQKCSCGSMHHKQQQQSNLKVKVLLKLSIPITLRWVMYLKP